MSETIMVPFSHLVLRHREIGIHRGRKWGFRDVFGFTTLRGVPFVTLASKVKAAYEGRDVPAHDGWAAQREALRWLVDQGHDGIYALDEQGIKLLTYDRRDALDKPRPALTVEEPPTADSDSESATLSDLGALEQQEADIGAPGKTLEITTRLPGFVEETGPGVEPDIKPDIEPNVERYYISDGHHRALALYVLGEDEIRAHVLSDEEIRARRAGRG